MLLTVSGRRLGMVLNIKGRRALTQGFPSGPVAGTALPMRGPEFSP